MRRKFDVTVLMTGIIIIAAILACLLILKGNHEKSRLAFDSKRVLFIAPHADNRYWSLVAAGAEYCAGLNGISFKTVEPISNNNNVSEIADMIEDAVDARVDAVVVRGEEDEAFARAVRRAKEEQIQVVFIDADNSDLPRDFYVGTDNEKAGRQMAEAVIGKTGGRARVALLTALGTSRNMAEREEGFREACRSHDAIEIVCVADGQSNQSVNIREINRIRQEYTEIDTLVALEGYGTLAMNTMAAEGELSGMNLFGFDYDSEHYRETVNSGAICGILTQQPYRMGSVCIEKLVAFWAEENAVPPESELVPAIFIDADNVDSYVEEGV